MCSHYDGPLICYKMEQKLLKTERSNLSSKLLNSNADFKKKDNIPPLTREVKTSKTNFLLSHGNSVFG